MKKVLQNKLLYIYTYTYMHAYVHYFLLYIFTTELAGSIWLASMLVLNKSQILHFNAVGFLNFGIYSLVLRNYDRTISQTPLEITRDQSGYIKKMAGSLQTEVIYQSSRIPQH